MSCGSYMQRAWLWSSIPLSRKKPTSLWLHGYLVLSSSLYNAVIMVRDKDETKKPVVDYIHTVIANL